MSTSTDAAALAVVSEMFSRMKLERDELRAELAVCRETNRRIHEQDTANVAKLQAIRAEIGSWSSTDHAPAVLDHITFILDRPGGGTA